MCFKITLLGTGAAIPTLQRGTSAQYINCQQRKILIDCGEGTQLKLRQAKIKFQNLQLILISHLHGDHILGLPGLISTMNLLGRKQKLLIIGPEGIENFIQSQLTFTQSYIGFEIEYKVLKKNTNECIFEDKCITIETFPLKHRIPTQGYRINEKPGKRPLDKVAFDKTGVSVAYIEKLKAGQDIVDNNGVEVKSEKVTLPPKPSKSYAYCSDTAYDESIIPFIKGVDVLYHEATFIEKEKDRAKSTCHSTAKQAALIAKKAGVKRLLLGHLSARYKEISDHISEAEVYFEEVMVPEDGTTIKIS